MVTSSIIYLSLPVILLILITIYLKLTLTYWKKRGVPYLKPSIPFGNFNNPLTTNIEFGQYFKEFYNEFKRMGKQFGGIYSFVDPVFVPVDPNVVKLILLKEFSSFHDRGRYHNERDQPVSVGITTVSGERWKELRNKLTPTFTSARIKSMFPLISVCSEVLEKHVKQLAINKKPMNAGDCMKRLTMDVIGSCAFGIECNSFEDISFYRSVQQLFQGRAAVFQQTFCNSFPKLSRAFRIPLMPPKQVDFIIQSMNETINFRSQNNVTRDDFLQILMEMKNKGILSMNEIYANSIVFFIGGHTTSATALSFALFELARHESVQDKLRKEIWDVIAKYNGKLTYEAVQKMNYLQMVLDETLRKYPPLTTLKRKCVKDCPIPNTNVIIEKGTMTFVPLLGLHYDPEYFPEPYKFIPERFSEKNISKIVPFTYLPFGDGPRVCIGERFGKLQLKMALITLVKNFKFTLHSNLEMYEFNLAKSPEENNILLNVEFIKA